MYLVIKELSGIAEDVIMVTQSLIKDIQSKQETIYRANAIRALCLITDVRQRIYSRIFFFLNKMHVAFHDPGY
jgi:vacuolar-type H+-ATPase subunit F/Vma7